MRLFLVWGGAFLLLLLLVFTAEGLHEKRFWAKESLHTGMGPGHQWREGAGWGAPDDAGADSLAAPYHATSPSEVPVPQLITSNTIWKLKIPPGFWNFCFSTPRTGSGAAAEHPSPTLVFFRAAPFSQTWPEQGALCTLAATGLAGLEISRFSVFAKLGKICVVTSVTATFPWCLDSA